MSFSNRSVKQREDTLTNKLAANTHVITRKTQIAQCAAVVNNGGSYVARQGERVSVGRDGWGRGGG